MLNILKRNNLWNFLFFLLSFLIIIFFYNKGPAYFPDSQAYINNAITDLPLYPLIIDIFTYLFTYNPMNKLVGFQVGLVLLSIYYLIYILEKNYKLNIFIKLIMTVLLLFPLMKMGNYILTEVIGYALSIFFFTFLIKSILENKLNFLMFLCLCLLVLLRPQFKLVYIFIFIYFFIEYIFFDRKIQIFVISVFSLIAIYFSANIIVHSYNKYYNGVNSDIKFGGTNYITTQLYIANKNDYKYIKEKELQNKLKIVLFNIDKDRLSSKYFNIRCHFALSMTKIRNYFKKEFSDSTTLEKYGYIDDVSKHIAFELLKHNFIKYIKYILRKPYDTTGLSIIFILIILLSGFYGMIKNKEKIFKLVFYISLFSLMNNFLIYAIARFQMRYLIYSDFILLSVLVLFFYVLIEKFDNKETLKRMEE